MQSAWLLDPPVTKRSGEREEDIMTDKRSVNIRLAHDQEEKGSRSRQRSRCKGLGILQQQSYGAGGEVVSKYPHGFASCKTTPVTHSSQISHQVLEEPRSPLNCTANANAPSTGLQPDPSFRGA